MKTKSVGKFIRCFKPTGVVDDDHGFSAKKSKCKGRNISDDLGDENIFLSSNNSYYGDDEKRKSKRKHKKIPRFLKEMRNKLICVKLKRDSTLEVPKHSNYELAAQFQRNSSDSSSSIFTSSSMASSSLTSTPLGSARNSESIPTKLKPSLSMMMRTCSNDQGEATIEAQNNINNNLNKQVLMEKAGGCYFGSQYGIWFIMFGLLALLIWGKVIATVFTLLCLYSASPRRLKIINNNNPQEILDDTLLITELSSESRVIMA